MYQLLKAGEEAYLAAGEAIRQGKVIVAPTDAVYALLCDANNPDAVARLREIRQSPTDKPLSLIIDIKDIDTYCQIRHEAYGDMMRALLPGKVSFLLHKKGPVFEAAVPNDSVCVFWQDNETRHIYRQNDLVLAISSANLASQPEATTVEQAIEYFGDAVPLYIDSGEERGSKGTLQLDMRTDPVRVMRESPMMPLSEVSRILMTRNIHVPIASVREAAASRS
ncbi:MAG: L-threonylcarbamoyladenylate synthase [Solirubrobacterales bacterium]